jgi:hypothetical protein
MAIFSRGGIRGAMAGGGPAPGAAPGGAPVDGARADPPPPLALLTADWQDGDNALRCSCRHCSDAMPPGGTLEQYD